MRGNRMAARIATIASTQTISISVKPRCALRPLLIVRGRNVRCHPGAPLLSVRPVGDDVVDAMLPGRAIDIGHAPRIVGDAAAFEVRSVPSCKPAGRPY